MGEYAIFNVCVSAAVILLTATYTTLYYVFLKKKGFAIVTPARVTCVVLAGAITLIGFENTYFINKEVDLRKQQYCNANTFDIEDIYEPNTNDELVLSKNLSIYGQYYEEDAIPGYERFEKIDGNFKYTYYIQHGHFYDTNNYTISPNFIIFAEYIGGEAISKFEWSRIAVEWNSGENIIDENEWFGTWKSDAIMIYGRFAYNIDSMEIRLGYASSGTWEYNGTDTLTIEC